jgi:hypothetical protein
LVRGREQGAEVGRAWWIVGVVIVLVVALSVHMLTGYLTARSLAPQIVADELDLVRGADVQTKPTSLSGPPWALTFGFQVEKAGSFTDAGDVLVHVEPRGPFVWRLDGYETGLE